MEKPLLKCSCGTEVFETDTGEDPNDGFVYCSECGTTYEIEEYRRFLYL